MNINPPDVSAALARLVHAVLAVRPDLAPDIATVATWLADVAGSVTPGPVAAAALPSAEPPPVEARNLETESLPGSSASVPAPPSVIPVTAPVINPAALAGTSAGFVPLRLGGEVKQLRLSGTSADLAAARQSAMDRAAETPRPVYDAPDLDLIAKRCDLKAESCRFVVERHANDPLRQSAAFDQRARDMLATAKVTPNCFLWSVYPGMDQPSDAHLTALAGTYANVAAVARLALRVPPGAPGAMRQRVLELLAEAQSALRVGLIETWLTKPDIDQQDAFSYVRDATTYERIFIERHMRLDDPGDPAAWQDLAAKITALASSMDADQSRAKAVTTMVNTVKYHAKAIGRSPVGDHDSDWRKIGATLRELERARALDDARLRSHLQPVAAAAPAEIADLVRLVLGERDEEAADEAREYSPGVVRVREWLRGKRMVLIGGERRDEAVRRISDAFELADLEWISLSEHASSTPMEAPIRRPDTALVLVLIRLSGHHHVDDARAYCERHDRPFVRLPAGYNPEQIAAQVIEQVSERLGPAE